LKKIAPKKVAEITPISNSGNVLQGNVSKGLSEIKLDSKQGADNMKQSGIEIGPNVLTGQPIVQSTDYTNKPPVFSTTENVNQKLASFGIDLTPTTIGLIVVAIILLVIAAKGKSK
jgi:hypothetical protein